MTSKQATAVTNPTMLVVFQVTTDLHSDKPHWVNLSFLPEHIALLEQNLFISLASISRVWVSSGLPDQLTCVSYKDKDGRNQTLLMRVQDNSGQVAGEAFKFTYRHLSTADKHLPAGFSRNSRVYNFMNRFTKRRRNLFA